MENKPRLAKAHSQLVADEYVRLGWTLCTEFRAPGVDEPYEFLLEWRGPEDPAYIDWDEFNRKHNAA
jgi:hypothetical protein